MDGKITEIMECLINPTKVKVLSGIELLGKATAKQLAGLCSDIPQATLYRTLNKLNELGIIEIIDQHPKRGTVEKVYALNKNSGLLDGAAIIQKNDGEAYLRLFLAFTQSLMAAFRRYAQRPGIDIQADGSGFTAAPICVTRDELQELGIKLAEVIEPYRKNTPEENRKNHTLALIFTPPAQ